MFFKLINDLRDFSEVGSLLGTGSTNKHDTQRLVTHCDVIGDRQSVREGGWRGGGGWGGGETERKRGGEGGRGRINSQCCPRRGRQEPII